MYLKKIKIGNVELENNIFLAPMAGITDLPLEQFANNLAQDLHIQKWLVAKLYIIMMKRQKNC